MGRGIGDGVERRVDNLDARALAARVGEAPCRARDAQEVAESTERDAAFPREIAGLVDEGDRRHADGAAGTGDELDAGRQERAQAEAENLMRMRAADFHDAQTRPAVGGDDLARGISRAARLCDRAHRWPPSEAVSARRAADSASSSEVIFAMASPACTIT